MAARSVGRALSASVAPSVSSHPFSATASARSAGDDGSNAKTTHFGFQTVREEEKANMVGSVFRRVAEK